VLHTTAEHPFYVAGKGWRAAGELQPGDRILGLGPQEGVAVVAVRATGRWVPLYNLRIADYHTYFVGDRDWEGAVWAHNASCGEHAQILRRNLIKAGEKEAKYAAHLVPTGDWSRRGVGVGDMVRQMQQWLNEARIGLDHPRNGFFTNSPRHMGTHTDRYIKYAFDELEQAAQEGREALLEALKKIRAEVMTGRFL
jgi:intein/homing endonuclease